MTKLAKIDWETTSTAVVSNVIEETIWPGIALLEVTLDEWEGKGFPVRGKKMPRIGDVVTLHRPIYKGVYYVTYDDVSF